MDKIFAAENVKGAISCAQLAPENYYCDKPLATLDPETGIVTGLKQPKYLYLQGGEGNGDVFVYDQRTVNTTDSYFLVDFDDGRQWVQAKTTDLRDLETHMAEIIRANSTKVFALSPGLQTVYLSKDGKRPLPAAGIFALKNDPNRIIGTLEIVLDMAETRHPTTAKSSVQFSYANHGEKRLNSYELFEANNASKVNPNKDPFTIKLPVLRKSSSGYLVQLPSRWRSSFVSNGRYQGAMHATDARSYAWIESVGIALKWKPGASDELPLFEDYELSPWVEFHMDKGPVYRNNGAPWTSLKINALHVDFDAPPAQGVDDNDDAPGRKKVFLREIFFPIFDAQKRIQLWPEYESGC